MSSSEREMNKESLKVAKYFVKHSLLQSTSTVLSCSEIILAYKCEWKILELKKMFVLNEYRDQKENHLFF